ncbi:hypothetical protein GCM10023217_33690 [Gordonia alkaliphila]|uniref:Uncharacterized protein n=1 Tax=Gordonia alkaliphila TaxID=1053547 RepID=A0ABP8ZK56_9ACTN
MTTETTAEIIPLWTLSTAEVQGESPGVVGFGGSLRAVDTPESLVSPLGWAIA